MSAGGSPGSGRSVRLHLRSFRGRPASFEGENERYVVTLRVLLDHKPSTVSWSSDDDLRCVAERAASAASGAYNLHNTRVVSVDIASIEGDEADE